MNLSTELRMRGSVCDDQVMFCHYLEQGNNESTCIGEQAGE